MWQDYQNCILLVQRNVLMLGHFCKEYDVSILFSKVYWKKFHQGFVPCFFCVQRKNFGENYFCDQNTFFNYSFGDNSQAVLSELHSDFPALRLDGKNFSKGIWCMFFCETWQEIFRLFIRNYFLRVWRSFVKKINSLKNTSLIFDEKISITVDKTSVYVTERF